jgi:hypothetical protein
VRALCRSLLEAGHDPATSMEVYRGPTLTLRVRSIGEAAKLTVAKTHGRPGLVEARSCSSDLASDASGVADAAPPLPGTDLAKTGHRTLPRAYPHRARRRPLGGGAQRDRARSDERDGDRQHTGRGALTMSPVYQAARREVL